uniref:E3_UbLigase_EDD domain-containing protein n=1 Tax=Meloidogyne hapla TaxID=6305 RepID=A0A1I8BK91_MELHA
MTESKQLLLFGHTLPGNENLLLERIKECADKRNKGYCSTSPGCTVLRKLPAEDILQVTAGHNYVAFLLKDHRIARLRYEVIANTIESSAPTDKNESGPGSSAAPATTTTAGSSDPASASANAAANAANRTAKIRRIMMTRPGTRSGGFCRTGVVIDRNRSRPLIPASSVPEDLIVQCQVVLQGKSRDVIVRELQRTNLNVNEAVNNLLSRDDDEMDDLDDTSEAYLHEELLSLLDAGLRSDGSGAAAAALLDSDSIYSAGDGYEYLISRDLAKRKGEDKTKDQNKDNADNSQSIQEHFFLDERFTYWGENDNDVTDGSTKFQFPAEVTKFLKIVSMHSELIVLADNGKLYGWSWEIDSIPNNSPHLANSFLFPIIGEADVDSILDIESCGLRTAVLTKSGRVGSFVDISCGNRLGRILSETPIEVAEPIDKLLCCTLYSAILTKDGNIFWRFYFT